MELRPSVFQPPNTVSITRTFDVPVTSTERLGSIPGDHYEWNPLPSFPIHGSWGHSHSVSCSGSSCELGSDPVYREVPVYTELGQPRMQTVTRTITESTYSQRDRALVFGSLGAAAGVGGAALAGGLQGLGAAHPLALTVGGVIGAAAAAAIGVASARGDEVNEQWVTREISHPTMTGYTHSISPDTYYEEVNCREKDGRRECDREMRVRGYHHNYSPDISWRRVGIFNEPTLAHTNRFGPVAGGALAAVTGGAIGAAIRLAAGLL